MKPLVSICVPTYRQTHLLRENLDSILKQTILDIEVLISDDTPGQQVKDLVATYKEKLPITYVHNSPSLGSPANWNAVLKRAQGEFVILLHHDDQFAQPDSLSKLIKPLQQDSALSFVFGRNEGIDKVAGKGSISDSFFQSYIADPALLVTGNIIGAPSNVCFRKNCNFFYDERFKWIVDIEYYTRLLSTGHSFMYSDEYLVKTGRHDLQITNECVRDHDLLLYENLTFAIEHISQLVSLTVYDFYWRLIRNAQVQNQYNIDKLGLKYEAIPKFIRSMIAVQSKVPLQLLRFGPVSRLIMLSTYALSR